MHAKLSGGQNNLVTLGNQVVFLHQNDIYMQYVHYAVVNMTCLTSVGVSKELVQRIKKDKDHPFFIPYSPMRARTRDRSLSLKIYAALGYTSINSFCQEAIRRLLNNKEREYDAIQEEREVGRRVLGKNDPGDL